MTTGRSGSGDWPTATTTLTGVAGDPIRHSLSPLLFNTAFAALELDWVMLAFPVPEGHAADALGAMRALGVAGLSVTMPLKSDVARLVDECTPTASLVGAVNSVRRDGDRLVGDNTDGAGFLDALARREGFDPAGRRCMVVGAGGAARAVVLALAGAGAAQVVVVNRTPGRAALAATLAGPAGRVGRAEDAGEMDLVVDATPAGMAGAAGRGAGPLPPLVDAALLGPGQLAVDLVYHPLTTPWLAEAGRRGATAVGGLGMLVHQAAVQLAWWTGAPAPLEAMWAAASRAVGGLAE
jgi:shikimate dehydrogenase